MIKLFGFFDLLAALFLLLVFLKILEPVWLVIAAGYLVIKGWIFLITSRDIASIADLGIGLFLFIFIFVEMPFIIMIIVLFWLIQKAAFSFI